MAQILEFPMQRVRSDGVLYDGKVLKYRRKQDQFDDLFYWMMFPWSLFGFTEPLKSR